MPDNTNFVKKLINEYIKVRYEGDKEQAYSEDERVLPRVFIHYLLQYQVAKMKNRFMEIYKIFLIQISTWT